MADAVRIKPTTYSAKGKPDPIRFRSAEFQYVGATPYKVGEDELVPGQPVILTFERYFKLAGDLRYQAEEWAREKKRVMRAGRGPMWQWLLMSPKAVKMMEDAGFPTQPIDTEIPTVRTSLIPENEIDPTLDPLQKVDVYKTLVQRQQATLDAMEASLKERDEAFQMAMARIKDLEGVKQDPAPEVPVATTDEKPYAPRIGRPPLKR
jgi:hypothetical protein